MSRSKIILADDLEEILDIITLMLESEFDYDVVTANSGYQAIQILSEAPDDFVLAISDYDMPDGNGGEFYQHVKENYKVPFILVSTVDIENEENLSGFFADAPYNAQVMKPFDHDDLINKIVNSLEIASQDSDHEIQSTNLSSDAPYHRIKIKRLEKISNAFSDTYIKISDEKYIKLYGKGDSFDFDKIQTYIDKGHAYLYLDKEQYNDFVNGSMKELISKLGQTNIDKKEMVTLQLTSIEQVQDVVRNIGVQGHVIKLTEEIANSVNKTMEKEKGLKDLMSTILRRENYFFELTNIINYISTAIIEEMKWDKEKTITKFITASTFCNISLDDEELAYFYRINNKGFKNLSTGQKAVVISHMKDSVDLVKKSISPDEEKLILSHHEKPDGSGYPKGLNASQIHVQTAAFIIAHDFAHHMIVQGDPQNMDAEKVFLALGPEYTKGNFAKPYAALKKALSSEG